jgi:hypothetical protein
MELEMNPAPISASESTDGRLSILALAAAAVLILSFSALIGSTLLGLQLGDSLLRSNPFADYEAVWPGQSIASLEAYARRTSVGAIPCYAPAVSGNTYDVRVNEIICTYVSDESLFRSMSVRVVRDQVQELTLFPGSLHQDNLFLYWGAPDSITRIRGGERIYLHWNRDTYEATAAVLDADYMVDFVILTRKDALS